MPRKKPKIEIKKLNKSAKEPTFGTGNPAGLDLYSDMDITISGKSIKPIKTGIAIAIEEGYYGQIEERSGISLNTPLSIKAGIIDSDYRGEIMIIMQNVSDFPHKIQRGDKIAQIIFHRHEKPKLMIVETFTNEETQRGEQGFGSSG